LKLQELLKADGEAVSLREIADFIDYHNKERPNWSLGFKTPEEVYKQLAA